MYALKSLNQPVFVFDVDGLPGRDDGLIVITGTLFFGDADGMVIKVLTLGAGATVHGQEVRVASLQC